MDGKLLAVGIGGGGGGGGGGGPIAPIPFVNPSAFKGNDEMGNFNINLNLIEK